ncbi:uncharacterized protein LOC129949284 [Eupeodes corollae]|uniref:uncharacterized protein LOC129949284 n=1 Tax=Eupeodes corollae TaxID=290404 RepID=UPI00249229A4|nr:uncharacterized protein LOC129949284 [Eupeodes corollae]
MNEHFIQYMSKPCTSIEHTFYCPKEELKNLTSEKCIPKIIQNKEATCDVIETTINSSITQPEEGFILLINSPTTKMTSTCGIDDKFISGTLLLHYEECEIKINNIIYKNKLTMFWDQIKIIPSIFIKINNSLHLDKFNSSTLEATKITNTEVITLTKDMPDHRPEFLIYIIIIFILTATILYLKRHRNNNPEEEAMDQEAPNDNVTLSWPSLHT